MSQPEPKTKNKPNTLHEKIKNNSALINISSARGGGGSFQP